MKPSTKAVPRRRQPPILFVLTLVILAVLVQGALRSGFIGSALKLWGSHESVSLGIYAGAILLGHFAALAARARRVWWVVSLLGWTVILFGIGPVAATLYLLTAATGLGHAVLAFARLSGLARNISLQAAIGFALMLGVLQVAALLPINTPAFVFLAALPAVVLQPQWLRALISDISAMLQERTTLSPANACLALPLTLLAILLVYVSYPESHSDALVVELMIAHQVKVYGKWSFDAATYAFAVMPKGAVWLFSAHYLLAGESAARLFNLVACALSAGLIHGQLRRHAGPVGAALLTGVFLSAPLTFWTEFVLFEDSVLNLFVIASVVVVMSAWDRPGPVVFGIVALLLSAAVATKTQGLFAAFPVAVVLLTQLIRRCPPRTVLLACGLGLLSVVMVAAVPYLIAYHRTGNPIFPFFNATFKSPYFDSVDFVDSRWIGKASPALLYDLTIHTSRFMEGGDGTFGLQHFILVPGILFALVWTRTRLLWLPVIFAMAWIGLAICFTQYARYLYPTFGLLSIGAAAFYRRAVREGWSVACIALFVSIAAVNVSLTRSLNTFYTFRLVSPLSSRPLEQPAPVPERRFNQLINAELGRDARVLYLGGRPYGFGLDGAALYTNWYSPKIDAAVATVQRPDDVAPLLASLHVTHVIIDTGPPNPTGPVAIINREVTKLGLLQDRLGSAQLWRMPLFWVTPGVDVSLGGAAGRSMLATGWRDPEPWGTWAHTESCSWAFRVVGRPATASLRVSGTAMPFPPSQDGPLLAKVYARGTLIAELRFKGEQVSQPWEFVVPAELIGADGTVELKFEFPFERDPFRLRLGMIDFRVSY